MEKTKKRKKIIMGVAIGTLVVGTTLAIALPLTLSKGNTKSTLPTSGDIKDNIEATLTSLGKKGETIASKAEKELEGKSIILIGKYKVEIKHITADDYTGELHYRYSISKEHNSSLKEDIKGDSGLIVGFKTVKMDPKEAAIRKQLSFMINQGEYEHNNRVDPLDIKTEAQAKEIFEKIKSKIIGWNNQGATVTSKVKDQNDAKGTLKLVLTFAIKDSDGVDKSFNVEITIIGYETIAKAKLNADVKIDAYFAFKVTDIPKIKASANVSQEVKNAWNNQALKNAKAKIEDKNSIEAVKTSLENAKKVIDDAFIIYKNAIEAANAKIG